MEKLTRAFYGQPTLDVAKRLLGKYLVHFINDEILIGKIVETEAYIGPSDKASHAYHNRRTDRTEIMYGPPGFAYVYLIYGAHYCMNIVTGSVNEPQAVLLRALEPIQGLDAMARNRFGKGYNALDQKSILQLTNGPGKLCKALSITRLNNGDDLCSSNLYITAGEPVEDASILSSPRINIDYAGEAKDYPWRYYIQNSPYVSYANKYRRK